MASDQMSNVLMEIGFESLVTNFRREHISPDIVHLLSKTELKMLGIINKEDMVKLCNACTLYGPGQPTMINRKSGPPIFHIPKSILNNFINDGFQIFDISKKSWAYRRGQFIGDCSSMIYVLKVFLTYMTKSYFLKCETWSKNFPFVVKVSFANVWNSGCIEYKDGGFEMPYIYMTKPGWMIVKLVDCTEECIMCKVQTTFGTLILITN